MTKALTLRLDPADYERLTAGARRKGLAPGALARAYVRAGLAGTGATAAEQRRQAGLDALDRLASLRADLRRAGYPSVDAVQLMRESREELEQRPTL